MKSSIESNLAKLPQFCAARLPSSGQPIIIEAGVKGYYEAKPEFEVEEYNAAKGISPAQVEAMLAGSMFGWGVPAANPEIWEK